MCCLQGEPYKIINDQTKEEKEYPYHGNYSYDKQKEGKLDPGFYYVCGSGSFYIFYDGKQCWHDKNDFGKPSEKYWQETGGYPLEYSKYSFQYKSCFHIGYQLLTDKIYIEIAKNLLEDNKCQN